MSEKVSDDYGSLKPFLFLTKALLIASMVCAIGFIVAFIIFITNVSSYVDEVAMIGLYLSIGFFAIGMNAIVLYAICKGLWQNRFIRIIENKYNLQGKSKEQQLNKRH